MAPTAQGTAVFLGNDKKVFVIYVDPTLGALLSIAMGDQRKDRPLTHDLIHHIMNGFGITFQRMVINNAVGDTFYARIVLKMENELGVKMVEVDSRPSDAMILALNAKKPIHVATSLWEKVEDATALMNKLLAKGN